ncbi:MAG: AMP-dependent synthetase/ligase [Candidatus Neomarinimicrobiota bacterium]
MMNTPKCLLDNIEKYPDKPAISVLDEQNNWLTTNWEDYGDYVFAIAKSMIAYGISADDKIAIYSYNRKEWYAIYAATQMVNAVAVGVYHTCSSDEVEWIVDNSDSKIVFIGNNPGDNNEESKMPVHRISPIINKLTNIEHVVLMEGIPNVENDKILQWKDFISHGLEQNKEDILSKINNIKEDDVSSLIYTSGTTGNPKGVEIQYKNWNFEVSKLNERLPFHQGDKYVSWLPLAHVFGQLIDTHFCLQRAMHLYVVDNPLNVVDHSKNVQPQLFIGVPRIYEKIYSNLKAAIDSKAVLKIGLKIPILNNVFKNILKKKTGFSETKYAGSGAAPINPDILKFFRSLDFPIYEGYGMTENAAVATINFQGNNSIGSVGKPIPGTEVKIADDGEILLKGDHVMRGYYKNESATNETIIDGWLYTGDIGVLDADGFLKITGRKKELYISSGGKNIAPLVIEETMKSITIVSQCFLIGDKRNYCTALFTLDVSVILRDKIGLDAESIPKDPIQQIAMLKNNGKELSSFTESDEVRTEIQKEVDRLNMEFSNPEQLKNFAILPRDFTIDDGELTPTLKMRRKQINQNWSEIIELMYDN